MKHQNQVADFANLDFEAIDTEILANETKEKEDETIAKVTDAAEGDNTTTGGVANETHIDKGHVEEAVSAPWKKFLNNLFFFFFSFFSFLVGSLVF